MLWEEFWGSDLLWASLRILLLILASLINLERRWAISPFPYIHSPNWLPCYKCKLGKHIAIRLCYSRSWWIPHIETAGDSLNLNIPDPSLGTMQIVCASVNGGIVLITGMPIVIEPSVASIDALVDAWLPTSECWRPWCYWYPVLLWTWLKTVDQLPMNVGYTYYIHSSHLGWIENKCGWSNIES